MTDDENLIIPDGYTIGPISEHYGTFKVFQGDRQIGRIGWHGDYYTKFKAGTSEISVTGYIKGDSEHAKQKGLNALVAFHKIVGDLHFSDINVSFTPNVFMNTFTMGSYYVTPIFKWIDFANVQRKDDGWHVEQLYGESCTTVYPSAQEAAQAATVAAEAKGKTVLYVAGEMIKAGWARDKSHVRELTQVWDGHKVQVNDDKHTYDSDVEVFPGDVIKWNEKTWTVK